MNAFHSKSAFVYGEVRRGLQSGVYLPGQRLDPTALASQFRTSPTPVRSALDRLVGEGLLEDHARSGLHVPLPGELALRDSYDWMLRLLLMACEMGISPIARIEKASDPTLPDADVAKLTWQLFDSIARATAHRSLHRTVKQANDRLAPIRRAKQGLLERPVEELSELIQYWHQRDLRSLERALRKYHERRQQLVPCIVAVLADQSSRSH
ncbi:GntR family transcriptional regulator [Luteimonas sp. SDU101]|uniref:GntR family transcriptional regulator n=1 Tax=Luteimonas sp. SDU101 TaxID=3422593 RepID=UPI003EBC0A8F